MDSTELIFKAAKRKTAVNTVIDSIKQLLIEQEIKPGQLLPNETIISEQLNVSRGSVREAFKILNAFGIIEIKQGDGTYVSNGANQNMFTPFLFQILVRERNFDQLIEVRQLLEYGIIRMSIEHATQDEILAIKKANDNFRSEIVENGGVLNKKAKTLDIEFHKSIAESTHNIIVQGIYNFVIDLFEPSMNPISNGVIDSHQGITDAIVAGDIEMAEKYLDLHKASWTSSYNNKTNK